ncbi:hypothetical protein ACFQL1_04035 [Halomicroarcula sp. GCM10025709]|uniref:hypothetical protein n=1 Tax=Haloarcula TaxID=2237 RepID=UPI0024C38014|nr:hypothetical protein [Halomicroarcula sp. YJ-61-S]
MVPPTRRRFLHGAAGLAAALTGCSGLTGGSASSTATAGERDDVPPDGGREMTPESVVLRTDSERPRSGSPTRTATSGRTRTTGAATSRRRSSTRPSAPTA